MWRRNPETAVVCEVRFMNFVAMNFYRTVELRSGYTNFQLLKWPNLVQNPSRYTVTSIQLHRTASFLCVCLNLNEARPQFITNVHKWLTYVKVNIEDVYDNSQQPEGVF